MKYLFFFNCQLLLLCCVCCKFAIQDFVQEDRQKYMEEVQKYWRFHRRVHRRTGTCRYFTESWKTFTELCHNHRRFTHIPKRMYVRGVVGRHVYRWICLHVYRRNYRRHMYRRIEKSGGVFEICFVWISIHYR
jgi:hypothetical protein